LGFSLPTAKTNSTSFLPKRSFPRRLVRQPSDQQRPGGPGRDDLLPDREKTLLTQAASIFQAGATISTTAWQSSPPASVTGVRRSGVTVVVVITEISTSVGSVPHAVSDEAWEPLATIGENLLLLGVVAAVERS
jgi:hypothetical protein